jgi:putative DNA primase/helicase
LAAAENGEKQPTQREEAAEMLRDGPMPQAEIEDAAKGHGHSWATVRRAKKALGIRSEKAGVTGGWLWSLPTNPEPIPKVLTDD